MEVRPGDNVAEAVCKSLYYSNNINVLHIYNSNHVYMKDLIKLLPDNTLEFVDNDIFDKKLNIAMKEANNTNSISFLVNDLDNNKHINYDNNIKATHIIKIKSNNEYYIFIVHENNNLYSIEEQDLGNGIHLRPYKEIEEMSLKNERTEKYEEKNLYITFIDGEEYNIELRTDYLDSN